MRLSKFLFLNRAISLISAASLALFGGVTMTSAQGQDHYHHSSWDRVQLLHQAQEYRRVQKLRRLQTSRRIPNYLPYRGIATVTGIIS